jgi:hypothetical protein
VRSARLTSVAVLALALALAASCARKEPETRVRLAYPSDLPHGAGRAIAERQCLPCHAASLINQQHKDSTAWAKTIAQMETWSAPMPPAERDTLLRYFAAILGPR